VIVVQYPKMALTQKFQFAKIMKVMAAFLPRSIRNYNYFALCMDRYIRASASFILRLYTVDEVTVTMLQKRNTANNSIQKSIG
jgi:hypothetical protein